MQKGGLFAIILSLVAPLQALAKPGDVDASFAPILDHPAWTGQIQADGHIVITGSFSEINGFPVGQVARLNPDGSADLSFTLALTPAHPVSAIVAPDDKILIGGSFTNVNGFARTAIVRLNRDGTVDENFEVAWMGGVYPPDGPPKIPGAPDFACQIEAICKNGDAIVSTTRMLAPDGSQIPSVVKILSNGTIDPTFHLAFAHYNYRFWPLSNGKLLVHGRDDVFLDGGVVALCNADGSLDASFKPFNIYFYLANAIEQTGGKVLLFGDGIIPGIEPGIVRLNPDGSYDPTFRGDVTSEVRSAALTADGKIMVGGYFTLIGKTNFYTVARLLPNGEFDPGYRPGSGEYSVENLLVQPDGKIVTVGQGRVVNWRTAESVRRFLGDDPTCAGVFLLPDTHFEVDEGKTLSLTVERASGQTGSASVDVTLTSVSASPNLDFDATPVHLEFAPGEKAKTATIPTFEDGNIEPVESFRITLQNPSAGAAIGWQFDAEAKILDNDGPASVVGSFKLQARPTYSQLMALAILPDNSILIGGNFNEIDGQPRPGVAKLKPDGSLDTSFNPQLPLIISDNPTAVHVITALADGRIVIGGFFPTTIGFRTAVFRLNADGSLDGPKAELASVYPNVYFGGIIPQGSALVVFGGFEKPSPGGFRLRSDGSLDSTFSTEPFFFVNQASALANGDLFAAADTARRMTPDGQTIFSFRPGVESWQGMVRAFAEAADGKIVLSGAFATLGKQGLIRITANGALDEAFAPDLNTFVGEWVGTAVAIQPNGKILASIVPYNGRNAFLVRLLENGQIDQSFEPVEFENTYNQAPLAQIKIDQTGSILVAGNFAGVNETLNTSLLRLKGGEENLERALSMRSVAVEGAATNAVVTLSVQPFKKFVVERSPDLKSWQPISTNSSVGTRFDFTDPDVSSAGSRFYRTRLLSF